jgi:hypothetical protein
MALEGSAEPVLALNVLPEIGGRPHELAAMLKPGGYAVVIDWNSEN